MAAMIIHGAQPGPMLMVNQPQFVYDVVGITLVATLAILVFGLILVRPMLWVLRVPREIIMPIVFVLCVLGSYSITQRLFDVWVMLGTGIVCFCAAPARLPGGAFRAGPGARRHRRQVAAPRAGAVRRQPAAVLHAADQRGAGGPGAADVAGADCRRCGSGWIVGEAQDDA